MFNFMRLPPLRRLMLMKAITGGGSWSTVTGNPVSFTARNAPLRQLQVAFSPVQDLHGYDSPWPAGGGKNLFDVDADISANAFYLNSEGVETATNNYRTTDYIPIKPDTSYFWAINGISPASTAPDHKAPRVAFYDAEKNWLVSGNALGKTGSAYTSPASAAFARLPVFVNTAVPTAMFVEGSTAPTVFSPYSNLCPISGWTSLHVYDDPLYAGVIEWNQLVQVPDGETKYGTATFVAENGIVTVNSSGTGAVGILNASPNPTFVKDHIYLMLGCPAGGGNNLYMLDTGAGIGRDYGSGTIRKYTGDTGAKYVQIYIFANYVAHDLVFKPQLYDLTQMFGAGNEPATVEEFKALFPHDYYPYNAGTETLVGTVNGMDTRSISISLGQTVYSGYVDVVTGEMTVTHKAVLCAIDLQNQLDIGTTSGGIKYADVYYPRISVFGGNALDSDAPILTSQYKQIRRSQTATEGCVKVYNNSLTFYGNRFTDKETAISLLAEVQVYFPITPLTIQLTPQEVESLAGDNTMWTDGDSLTVEYRSN